MPRLILLRHAHAKPAAAGQADHDRPLKRRGREEAAKVGATLAGMGEAPDLVLCSTSLRTRQTLEGVMAGLQVEPEVLFLSSLFEGPNYAEIIRDEAGDAASLLVVGHNPFIQEGALTLSADRRTPDGEAPGGHFPPGAFAVLTGDGKWRDLRPGTLRLAAFVKPLR